MRAGAGLRAVAVMGLLLGASLRCLAAGPSWTDSDDALSQGLAAIADGQESKAHSIATGLRSRAAAYGDQSLVTLADLVDAAADASLGEWSTAVDLVREALTLHTRLCRAAASSKACGDYRIAWESMRLLARADVSHGLTNSALERAQAALELAQRSGDTAREIGSWGLMMQVEIAEGDAEKAASSLDAAKRLTLRSREGAQQLAVELLAAATYASLADPVQADRAIAAGLGMARRSGRVHDEVELLLSRARLEERSGSLKEAGADVNEASALVRQHGIEDVKQDIDFLRGLLDIDQGELKHGMAVLEAQVALYGRDHDLARQIETLRVFADALERRNEAAGALALYDRELPIVREAMTSNREDILARLRAIHDRGASQVGLAALEKDNEIKTVELHRQHLNQRLWLCAAGTGGLAATIAGTLYWRTRRSNRQLAALEAELRRQGRVDPLTGLANRRAFRESIETSLIHDGAIDQFTGAILLIDLDRFKSINDTFGHDVGDQVLAEVARRLAALTGPNDLAVRWGGEEFLLLQRQATSDDIAFCAQRILVAIAATPIRLHDGRELRTSGSVGFARFPLIIGALPATLSQAVWLADLALGHAKVRGRNRAFGVSGVTAGVWDSVQSILDDFDCAIREGSVALQEILGPGRTSRNTAGVEVDPDLIPESRRL